MVYCLDGYVLKWLFLSTFLLLFICDLLRRCRQGLIDGADISCQWMHCHEWLKLVRKVRYILLFLLLVYAFNTPGEYLASWDILMMPTYEGIATGIEQAMRLALILAGLAILLVNTSREQFISGCHDLMQPLGYIGLDPERFAVRLWLTLYYVEHSQQIRHESVLDQLRNLEQLIETDDSAPEKITLIRHQMRLQDYLQLALMLVGAYLICV
jgi:energy-coupling factor transporter transmembrane protein EcfT